MRRTAIICLGAVLCASAAVAQPAPLRVIRPLPVGAAGTGADPDARWFRQPAGVDYTIRAEVHGGTAPYASYVLSNAPAGMAIEGCIGPVSDAVRRTCGTITWPNPQASASNITVTVSDGVGAQASATWSITVGAMPCGADGACFLDAACVGCDDTGDGSEGSPFQTISRVQTIGARAMVFLMGAGEFSLDGTTTQVSECLHNGTSATGLSATFTETTGPVIFVDYPDGVRPIVNIGYVQGGVAKACFENTGQNLYMSGLEIRNCTYKCVENQRSNEYGATYWDMIFRGTGIGQDGANSAALMYAQRYSQRETPYWDVVTQSEFYDIGGGGSGTMACIKNYSQRGSLQADNIFVGARSAECVAHKSDVEDFETRNNRFIGIIGTAIGGNMHWTFEGCASPPQACGVQTRGVIRFNYVEATTYCLEINQDGQAGPIVISRNTLRCEIHIRSTDSADGPFTFTQDVIINGQAANGSCPAKFDCTSVSDFTRIVHTPCGTGTCNLIGVEADGILDGNGDLVVPFLAAHGPSSPIPKGHMVGASVVTQPHRLPIRLRASARDQVPFPVGTASADAALLQGVGQPERHGTHEDPQQLGRHDPGANQRAVVHAVRDLDVREVALEQLRQLLAPVVSLVVRVRRLQEIPVRSRHEERAAWLQHARDVAHERLVVLDVLEDFDGDDDIIDAEREARTGHVVVRHVRNVRALLLQGQPRGGRHPKIERALRLSLAPHVGDHDSAAQPDRVVGSAPADVQYAQRSVRGLEPRQFPVDALIQRMVCPPNRHVPVLERRDGIRTATTKPKDADEGRPQAGGHGGASFPDRSSLATKAVT